MAGIQEFFAMGGHGLYVWLSYGLSLSVIVGLLWRLRSSRRAFISQARARAQRTNADPVSSKS